MGAYPDIKRIVLTGGPSGGKTESLKAIKKHFRENRPDVQLIVVSELATDIFQSGYDPAFISGREDLEYYLQREMICRQLSNEKFFVDSDFSKMYFKGKKIKKVVVIFDRGIADMTVYLKSKSLPKLMNELKLDTVQTHHHYDGVIHLVTAANGVSSHFHQRHEKEDADRAINLDHKIIKTWSNHEKLVIVPNVYQGKSISFKTKIALVIKAIESIIGNPIPIEKEQKFLLPNGLPKDLKEKIFHAKSSLIHQIYLKLDKSKSSKRVRAIEECFGGGDYRYFTLTEKSQIDSGKFSGRFEDELLIGYDKFQYLSETRRDVTCETIVKQRLNIILGPERDYEHWFLDCIIRPSKYGAVLLLEYENILKDKITPPEEIFGPSIEVTDKFSNKDIAQGLDVKQIAISKK